MKLKITVEDYAVLRDAVHGVIRNRPEARQDYLDAGLSDMRYRWDMLWASRLKIGSAGAPGDLNLYDYLNDDHIDSALKRIVSEFVE